MSLVPTISRCLAVGVVLSALGVVSTAQALDPGPSGFYVTGAAKRVGPDGSEFTIIHEMKQLPKARTAEAVREADISKRFTFTFTRDMPCERFKSWLSAGFARSGLTSASDRNRATSLGAACTKSTIKARSHIVLFYNADTKATVLWVEKMGTVSLGGVDAMRGIWSLWFAHPEQEKMRSSLLARL